MNVVWTSAALADLDDILASSNTNMWMEERQEDFGSAAICPILTAGSEHSNSDQGSVVMPRLLNRIAAKFSVPAIAASAAFAILTGSAQGQPLTIQTISAGQALKVVNAAIAACSEPGPIITISIAVVDQAGNPRLMLNADTANPHNLDLARRKAYTARTFRRPSIEWAKDTAGNPQNEGQRQMVDVIPLGGGVPIMAKGQVIGGVGISGAKGGQPAENDCAAKAAASIANESR